LLFKIRAIRPNSRETVFVVCQSEIDKMRSELQQQTARANGSKSRGPVTTEGKRVSSRNAIRHGLLAKTVLIEGESAANFTALLAELHAEFQPLPGSETNLVETMAACRWRMLRLWGMESASLTHEIRNHKEMSQEPLSPITHAVFATRNLTDHSRLLDFLARQEARYHREYANAHKSLLALRGLHANKIRAIEPGPLENSSPEPLENTNDFPELETN
jgi:hypothetical protein